MRVLLDHDVPHSLRHRLSDAFEIETAQYNGWQEYADDGLLEAAEKDFSVLLTLDRDFKDEGLIKPHDIGVVLLDIYPGVPNHLMNYETEMYFGIPLAAEKKRLVLVEDQFEDRLITAALGEGNVREELERATSKQ